MVGAGVLLAGSCGAGRISFEPCAYAFCAIGGLVLTSPVIPRGHRRNKTIAPLAYGAIAFDESFFEVGFKTSTAFSISSVVCSFGPDAVAIASDRTIDVRRVKGLNTPATE